MRACSGCAERVADVLVLMFHCADFWRDGVGLEVRECSISAHIIFSEFFDFRYVTQLFDISIPPQLLRLPVLLTRTSGCNMALTNAERQARWRERQKAYIKALEEDRSRLQQEVKRLLKELKETRKHARKGR